MADHLRWGILGTGNIARQFCAGVAASERGKLAAVASRQLESARAFAEARQIPIALGSYDDLLGRDDVDAIYVSLPNSLHHDWTIAALKAGKHVLCEKPFAVTLRQAEAMFAAAKAADRVVMEAFMYRCHPQTLAVQQAIADGAIGEVRQVRTSFCYKTSKLAGNVRFDPSLAGGSLMDVGCYCLSFALLLAGPAVAASAAGHVHPSGVDDLATGWMQHENDAVSSFTCGTGTQANNTAFVCGTDGYLEIPVPWKPPTTGGSFTIAHSTPPKQDFAGSLAPSAPPHRTVQVPPTGDLYGVEADDFAAAVLDGQTPRVTREETFAVTRWLETLRRQVGLAY